MMKEKGGRVNRGRQLYGDTLRCLEAVVVEFDSNRVILHPQPPTAYIQL